ncbi:MAG: PBP1A family penicillin-binding protein [Candidatus Marinimicrobia bacterium]|nr:PBP1A family penicillin-binding protein [Candidatus Neomarinimicrobiota bacterium]
MGKAEKEVEVLSWIKAFKRVFYIYCIGGVLVLALVAFYSKDLPSIEQLQNFNPELVTRIYSSDGVILQELYTQRRIYVPLDKIPHAMIDAVVAVEDSRFYKHWGISLRDNYRALTVDVLTLSKAQGASTLTQQLARILYESIGFDKTFSRKIKELLTALQIERMYGKDEIAEMYINSSWMGHGVYGIQAAARRYFNKTSEQLTPDECALLAGVIKNSVRFSPLRRPVSAFERRNLVLRKMEEKGFLTEEEYALYKNAPLQVLKPEPPASIAPYFVEYVRQLLTKEDDKYGFDIYRDGLSIYTTLDSRVQSCADSAFIQHLSQQQQLLNQRLLNSKTEIQSLIKDTTLSIQNVKAMIRGEVPMAQSLKASFVVQGALVAIDPSTGKILAMVGGRDFSESEFNRATQAKRQPGSVFKPIVFAAAIDNGFPVTTMLLNQPLVINLPDGTRWAPENYDLTTSGNTTLRDGLTHSLNLVAARVVHELISPSSVVQMAKHMHITTKMPAVESIALGSAEVIPLEITSAFGIFDNHGVWVEPYAIKRIEDKYGNVIVDYSPRRELALSEETAYLVTSMMESVINRGTGVTARSVYGFRLPAAGKTGTSNDYSDAWFIGFTPNIVAGVWVGVDNPAVSLGNRQAGAVAALPIWATFMRDTHYAMRWHAQGFTRPDGIVEIEICKETKLLPSKYCPLETEVFAKSTLPTEQCPIHKEIPDTEKKEGVTF